MKTDNRSFEMVEEFKYAGKTLKNQNSNREEIEIWECLLPFGVESFVF
jgi:hypothetical protein